MIRKSGNRFSEKIVLNQRDECSVFLLTSSPLSDRAKYRNRAPACTTSPSAAKEMVMLTPSLSPSIIGQVSRPAPRPAPHPFAEIAGHAGLIATEYTYKK